jgi:hypothetical protein
MKIQGVMKAWLSPLSELNSDSFGNALVQSLTYTDPSLKMDNVGYTYVGEATISVMTEFKMDDLIAGRIAGLNLAISEIRAVAESRCIPLKEEIKRLQAITYNPSTRTGTGTDNV